jgi:hypothetical protein
MPPGRSIHVHLRETRGTPRIDQQKLVILLIKSGIHPKVQQLQMCFSSLGRRRRNGGGLNPNASGAMRRMNFES